MGVEILVTAHSKQNSVFAKKTNHFITGKNKLVQSNYVPKPARVGFSVLTVIHDFAKEASLASNYLYLTPLST